MKESKNLTTDLTFPQLSALLLTLIEDKHAVIRKLEVRLKANGYYRVITNVYTTKDPVEK